MRISIVAGTALAVALLSTAAAAPAGKLNIRQETVRKPLDPTAYDSWKRVGARELSRNGLWLATTIAPEEGDSDELIKNLNGGANITVPRGSGFRFSKDSNFAIGMITPPFADVRAAKRKKAKPEDMPKSALAIVDLKSGKITQIDKVASFILPEEDSGWMAYKLEPPKDETPAKSADAAKPAGGKEASKPKDKKPGQPLVIRNLASGKEETIPFVTQAVFAKNGTALIYATATKDGKGDGAWLWNMKQDRTTNLMDASGEYPQLAIDQDGDLAAFAYRPPAPEPKTPAKKDDAPGDAPQPAPLPAELYLFRAGAQKPEQIGLDSLPKGWVVNGTTPLQFSERATRLVYATSPLPPPPVKELPDDEKVSVDIWTYKDSRLMPLQLLEAERDRTKGYMAIYDVKNGKSMQVADKGMDEVQISEKDDGRYALGSSSAPYDLESSWDPGYSDYFLIDLQTNKRSVIARRYNGVVRLSPKGAYALLYDENSKGWIAIDCASGKRNLITSGIPCSLVNELEDHPQPAQPYGIVGWLSETSPVVADRYDLWLCDAEAKAGPKRLTFGRSVSLEFRPIVLDRDALYLPANDLLLTAFNQDSKQDGVYSLHDGVSKKLMMADKSFGGYMKAKDSDRLLFIRQDFNECPDLWVTDMAFDNPVRVTDANPQQKDYLWGTAELVRWTSLDGLPLSGILIKPGNFDYGKKYPMITYYYERNSDFLHAYRMPAPSSSEINPTYMASNGYVVFIPDIVYRVGYPGYSALAAIVPGVESVIAHGYVDPKRLGIEGMSWGGYETAYLVTQTNMFAAAESGAPVGDMFSAYGGIRYGSGLVREMQYEHGQSRIGGTPWDSTLRYMENSPVFFADKIQTPLMIMSNDQDDAVPHTQGIELFTALRRLGKPSWMVVYNGEHHGILQRKNQKDFDIRLNQFFDHYLKDAPMPEWMAKGIPAVDKGRNMGLDLMKPIR